MAKTRLANFILENKWTILIITALLIIVFVLFVEKQNLKYSFLEYKAIPHINLSDTFYPTSNTTYGGAIRGFVVFPNKSDQPKDMRQYYIIEATDKFDEDFNQIFDLDEIVALYPLPPQSVGKVELLEKSQTRGALVLVDKDGNEFTIDKIQKTVVIKDRTGDTVSLITDNLKYRKFMIDFLSK